MPPVQRAVKSLTMFFAMAVVAVALGAQPPATIGLSFGEVYLSDVMRGLESVENYRQHYRVTLATEGGDESTNQVSEWFNESLANGDRHSGESYSALGMAVDNYLLDGQAFLVSQSAGAEPMCMALPDYRAQEPQMITVANMTGFKSATLANAQDTVNGIASHHYRLDPPVYNPNYDEGSLQGDLWLAQDGGYIVKFVISGKKGEQTQTWEYDLTSITEIVAPEACAAVQ